MPSRVLFVRALLFFASVSIANLLYAGSPPTSPVKVTPPSSTIKLLSRRVDFDRWSDTGITGYANQNSHFYLKQDMEVDTNRTPSHGSVVTVYDPLAQSTTTTASGANSNYPGTQTIQSETLMTWSNPPLESGSIAFSQPFFGDTFKAFVETHVPDFSGNFGAQGNSAFIEYVPDASLGDVNFPNYDPAVYEIANLQYKWSCPSGIDTTVIWDVQYTPRDYLENSFLPIGPVQHNLTVWQSQGAVESPTYTIKPLELNNKANGDYKVVQISFELLSDLNNDGQMTGGDEVLKAAAAKSDAGADAIEAGTEYLFVNDKLSNGLWDAEDVSVTKPPSSIKSDDDAKRLKTICTADYGVVWFEYPGGQIANLAFYTSNECTSANQVGFPYSLSPTHLLPSTLYVRAEGTWSGQCEGKLVMKWGADATSAPWATDQIIFTVVTGFGDTKFFNAARDYILENDTRFWSGYKIYGTSPDQQTVRFVVMREEALKMKALDTFWRPQPLWGIDAVVAAYPDASVAINGNFTFDIQNVGWFKNETRRCQGRLVTGGVLNSNVSSDNDDPNVPSPNSPLHGSEYAGENGKYIAMTSDHNFQIAKGRVPLAPIPQEAMGGFSTNYGRGNQDQMIGIGKLNTGTRMVFTATVTSGAGVTNSVSADAQKSGVPALPGGSAGELMLILGDANTSIALAYRDPSDKLTVVNKGDKHTFIAQAVGKYCINTYLLFYCGKPR